jgi:hypothetical protein
VTEQEWLACTDPRPMLYLLLGANYPRVQDVEAFLGCKGSDRKLRLFACACYARLRHLLPSKLARDAVEVAERLADGLATEEELRRVDERLQRRQDELEGPWRASRGAEREALTPTHEGLALARVVSWPAAPKAAYYASSNAYLAFAAISNPGAASSDLAFCVSQGAEEEAQADLLRDIFGPLPFRPLVLPASVRAWGGGTVARLAAGVYEERDFTQARMGVLADAAEEAGLDDAELLAHLRSPVPHARGCWGVDLLLGRE